MLLTVLGRWVLACAVVSTAVGLRFGWSEVTLIGVTLLLVLLLALPWALGRGPEHVAVSADPERVSVGEHAVARVISHAPAGRRVRGIRIEVPIRTPQVDGLGLVDLPAVAAEQVARRDVLVPTDRRAVVRLGPIRAVRSDPIGLVRRAVAGGGESTVFVHPRVVPVPSNGAGLLRDLEGRTTSDPSPSDAAFHALREYVPGDDRRHVHWRTSMRLGQLMVRQFVDVRRSELTLICDTDPAGYADEAEFESAISVVASLAVQALTDQVGLSLLLNGPPVPGLSRVQVLDALAAVEATPARSGGPVRTLQHAARQARGDAVVIGGTHLRLLELASAAASLGSDLTATCIRVAHGEAAARSVLGRMPVLQLGAVDDLARVYRPVSSR